MSAQLVKWLAGIACLVGAVLAVVALVPDSAPAPAAPVSNSRQFESPYVSDSRPFAVQVAECEAAPSQRGCADVLAERDSLIYVSNSTR